jgi:RNase P subunit RPR2
MKKNRIRYSCADKMAERPHIVIPVGLRRNICATCGGLRPAIKLPRCRACLAGMAYDPARFKEMRHELRTEDHPMTRVPKAKKA